MPLGKYYCDYCDKEFRDIPSTRKRHLQGIHHHRAKAAWYDSFKESNQVYPESFNTGVCNRFFRTGFCQYGDACKYYHPKQKLGNIHSQSIVGFPGTAIANNTESQVGLGDQSLGGSSLPGLAFGGGFSRGDLPPSLQPPPEGGHPPLPFIDWG